VDISLDIQCCLCHVMSQPQPSILDRIFNVLIYIYAIVITRVMFLSFFLETIRFLIAFGLSLITAVFRCAISPSFKDISEDIILITGGGRGIGRLLAVEFAKHRPKQIVLWGRSEEPLKATSKAVQCHNVACTYMVCDVSDKKQVYEKAASIRSQLGVVTILVNNAGVVFGDDVLDSKDDDIVETLNVNALSHFWTVRAFLGDMKNRGRGHIVCMASLLSFLPLPGAADYCASKAAVASFAENLRLEVRRDGRSDIRVTSVHPYLINTDMFAGLGNRLEWLLPALDKDYVAERTVKAVLTNQDLLVMPRIFYFFILLKWILPTESHLLACQFLGQDTAMETHHRRIKNK